MADVVVLLEVTLLEGQKDGFLAKAEQIQSHLAHVPGFVRSERFQSVSEPNKVLSLSVWKDNESVKAFLTSEEHRKAQRESMEGVFSDYRITVASADRVFSPHEHH